MTHSHITLGWPHLLPPSYLRYDSSGKSKKSDMTYSCMRHAPYMNESCPMYGWVMPRIWMSRARYMNESCPMYEWVMPHVWMSHAPDTNESCPIYEWVMSQDTFHSSWRESGHRYQGVVYLDMCHTYQYEIRLNIWICVTHINIGGRIYWYMWHVSL